MSLWYVYIENGPYVYWIEVSAMCAARHVAIGGKAKLE